jgi:hypothetical protein
LVESVHICIDSKKRIPEPDNSSPHA